MEEIILYAASWLIRIFGSFLDGLVGRGRLSWLEFHLLNWLRRDIPIIGIYIILFNLDLFLWIVSGAAHLAVHWIMYSMGEIMKKRLDK